VATHLGTAFCSSCLFWPAAGRNLDFDAFTPALAGLLDGFASFCIRGGGVRDQSGLMPLHVWLPRPIQRRPAMSRPYVGVMIKTGIYGLLRLSAFLGPPALGGDGC